MVRYFRSFLAAALAVWAPHVLAFEVGAFTLTGPTDIVIPEDGADHDFLYTLTNNSGETMFGLLPDTGLPTFLSGDANDQFDRLVWDATFGGATCGSSLDNGASCTLALAIIPKDGSGEVDADFGAASIELIVHFAVESLDPDISITPTITITDPGFVPEPATLALLGIGLAGLGFSRRKRNE